MLEGRSLAPHIHGMGGHDEVIGEYFGEGVSVRQAECLLAGKDQDERLGADAEQEIRERIAADNGQKPEDVFLYPSGMAAVAATHRALISLFPGLRSVQFDFPYVDVLRLQQEIGSGVVFLPSADGSSVDSLQDLVEGGESLCGVYCEVPSNPLLTWRAPSSPTSSWTNQQKVNGGWGSW